MSLLEEAFWGAGWDESEHPRAPKGTKEGGRWVRIEDGYENADVQVFDNGAGVGPTKGSKRWAVMKDGKWVANEDTLAEAKAKAAQVSNILNTARGRFAPRDLSVEVIEFDQELLEEMLPEIEEQMDAADFEPGTARSLAESALETDGTVAVAYTDDGQLSGVVSYRLQTPEEHGTPGIYVDALATTRGPGNVGTELMRHVAQRAVDAGLDVQLTPVADAIPFYEKIGMREENYRGMVWTPEEARAFLTASGWDETKHPRWSAGDERGGEFRSKAASAAYAQGQSIQARNPNSGQIETAKIIKVTKHNWLHVDFEDGGGLIRLTPNEVKGVLEPIGEVSAPRKSKIPEAKALRDRLYEVGVDDELGPWVLEDWGNWTLEQKHQLKAYLDKQLHEGSWEQFTNPDTGSVASRRIPSGVLSVDYSREIGMSFSRERNQARSLRKALDNNIALDEAEMYGFTPEDYAPDLFGEEAVAARRKTTNIKPRDQGIPEDYLTEKGSFKPGYDAKLKSDLVNSYFELSPKKLVPGQVSAETKQQAVDTWRSLYPSQTQDSAGREYTDAELESIALAQTLEYPADLRSRIHREQRQQQASTLIHRFDPADAKRIIQERGWQKFLEQKRDKLGGLIERDPATANQFMPGLGDQIQSELARAHDYWGDDLVASGERFGKTQAHVGELAHIDKAIAKGLREAGVKIYVGPGESTDLDEMWSLRDERARGWGNTYLNKVGGFYSPSSRTVIASTTAPSSTDGLMSHEIGHAIGNVYGIDNLPELIEHHKRVYPQLRSYFKQGPPGNFVGRQELWAEGVSAVTRNRMEREFDRRVIGKGRLDTGPFNEVDYDKLSPAAQDYLAWVSRTLEDIAAGKHAKT